MMKSRTKSTEVIASTTFDSFTQPVFAGARGTDSARQLVLRAADFDIHIKISGKPAASTLLGQILTREQNDFVNTASAHLLRNDERIGSAEINSFGEFEFANLPEGSLRVQIDLPKMTVYGDLDFEEVA